MDVSGLLVAVAAAAALAAALIGRRAYLRWVRAVGAPKDERLDRKAAGAATGPSATGSRSRKWNVELQVPSRKRACREALTLSGRHFPNGAVPPVPLPHCSVPHRCRCSFVKVTDRRSHTQRSGQERRWGERDETEKIDRRVAEDRRADAHCVWQAAPLRPPRSLTGSRRIASSMVRRKPGRRKAPTTWQGGSRFSRRQHQ